MPPKNKGSTNRQQEKGRRRSISPKNSAATQKKATKPSKVRSASPATAPTSKAKLRTAKDVISRFRWSSPSDDEKESQEIVMIGYDDRINGPMEVAIEDFVPISEGGDIPEHRILYFRVQPQPLTTASLVNSIGEIIWDRAGRVDKVFGSGNGASAPISSDTFQAASAAVENMRRLEEERQELRALKAQERSRRAQRRILASAAFDQYAREDLQSQSTGLKHFETDSSVMQRGTRHKWLPMPSFSFAADKEEWVQCLPQSYHNAKNAFKCTGKGEEIVQLSVLTWNILFDLYDKGEPNSTDDNEATDEDVRKFQLKERWKLLADQIEETKADVVSLQEVTPTFANYFLSLPWVQQRYHASASPGHLQSVTPCGVLLLWSRDSVWGPIGSNAVSKDAASNPPCADLYACVDGGRYRSLIAVLRQQDTVSLVAAVHLPAEKPGEGIDRENLTGNRYVARKRERCAIVGQLQRLEECLLQQGREVSTVNSVIAGDFNCQWDSELEDGSFAGEGTGFFTDAWLTAGDGGEGHTFDPVGNPRASRSTNLVAGTGRPRRIDRVYVGWRPLSPAKRGNNGQLLPKTATILGSEVSESVLPPSDHYGLFVTMESRQTGKLAPSTPNTNAWAANAIPSPDTLLGITLDHPAMKQLKSQHDPHSSLPEPHITILHGFVELSGAYHDWLLLSLASSIQEANGACSASSPPPLEFHGGECLQVFEHQQSCTLVACPEKDSEGGDWLYALYDALRARFRLCDEQERHFAGGWNPHVTLGKFGSSAVARSAAAEFTGEGKWKSDSGDRLRVECLSLDVYQRQPDGMIHCVASVPTSVCQRTAPLRLPSMLDAGASMSTFLRRNANAVVADIESACRRVVGRDSGLHVSVHLFGSMAMNVALPQSSDCDAIVVLQPETPERVNLTTWLSPSHRRAFLADVSTHLQMYYPTATSRVRSAGPAGYVLTVTNIPSVPSVDLTMAICDYDGNPIDDSSWTSVSAVDEVDYSLRCVELAAEDSHHDPLLVCDAYKGALRIVKYWAQCRSVYSATSGYLGGASWSVFLAKVLIDCLSSGRLNLPRDGTNCLASASNAIARNFFLQAANMALSEPIKLEHDPRMHAPVDADTSATSLPGWHEGLTIMAPISRTNIARGSTGPTRVILAEELRGAASHLSCYGLDPGAGDNTTTTLSLEKIFRRYSAADLMEAFETVLSIQVVPIGSDGKKNRTTDPIVSHLEAIGSLEMVRLVSELGRATNGMKAIRPLGKPLLVGCEWKGVGAVEDGGVHQEDGISPQEWLGFVWLIGIQMPPDQLRELLEHGMEEHTLRMKESLSVASDDAILGGVLSSRCFVCVETSSSARLHLCEK